MTAPEQSALLLSAAPAKRRYAAFEGIVLKLTFYNPTATERDAVVSLAADGADILCFDLVELETGRKWECCEESSQSLILYKRRPIAPRSSITVTCAQLAFRTEGRDWHRGLPPGRYIIECSYEPARARMPGPPLMALRAPPAEVVVKKP